MLSKTLADSFGASGTHRGPVKWARTARLAPPRAIWKILMKGRMQSKLSFQKLVLDKSESDPIFFFLGEIGI